MTRWPCDIALNYLPSEKPDSQEVIALIETAGRKAVALAGDIRDEGFCSQLVADSLGALGGLDLLVNVAGHQQARESIADATTEQFDETFKTNVYAIFWLCKAALPHTPAGAGIINTASIQSYSPSPTLLDYASTKAATVAFTKALTKQVAPRVSASMPWRPVRCGLRFRRAAASRRRRFRISGAKFPWADTASQPSWHRSMFFSLRRNRATSRAKSTG